MYLSQLDSTGWNGVPRAAEDAQEAKVDLRTVLHPQLDITVAQDESDFTRIFCHKNRMRKILSQRPVLLTFTDHDTIIDEVNHRDKL